MDFFDRVGTSLPDKVYLLIIKYLLFISVHPANMNVLSRSMIYCMISTHFLLSVVVLSATSKLEILLTAAKVSN